MLATILNSELLIVVLVIALHTEFLRVNVIASNWKTV